MQALLLQCLRWVSLRASARRARKHARARPPVSAGMDVSHTGSTMTHASSSSASAVRVSVRVRALCALSSMYICMYVCINVFILYHARNRARGNRCTVGPSTRSRRESTPRRPPSSWPVRDDHVADHIRGGHLGDGRKFVASSTFFRFGMSVPSFGSETSFGSESVRNVV